MACLELCVVLVILPRALALELLWPNFPEAGTDVSVQFFDGTPPYQLQITNQATGSGLYTYNGNNNVTYWFVDVASGTVVLFKVTDVTGLSLSSTPVTITVRLVSNHARPSGLSLTLLDNFAPLGKPRSAVIYLSPKSGITPVGSESRVGFIRVYNIACRGLYSTTLNNPHYFLGFNIQPPWNDRYRNRGIRVSGHDDNNFSDLSHSARNHSKTGAVAGGVIGCAIVVCLALLVAIIWVRRRKGRDPSANMPSSAYLTANDRMRYFDSRTETATVATATGASLYTSGKLSSFPDEDRSRMPSFLGATYPILESDLEQTERYPPLAPNFSGLPEVQQ
ncbi:hypothetical protein DL93DRAFT_2092910 [Clavulina sp. PMI_390]|nr:hypothetical protein DL93DRAFT_2092910 [Clavulina sp. PMI_390]